MTDDRNALNIRGIPQDLRLQFRAKALLEGKNMQDKIRELMEDYVNEKRRAEK